MKSRSFCFAMLSNNFALLTQFNTTDRFHLWRVHMYTCGIWGVLSGFMGSRREQAFVEHLYVTMSQAWGQATYSFISLKSLPNPSVQGWTLYREVKYWLQGHRWASGRARFTSEWQTPSLCSFCNVKWSPSKPHLATFWHRMLYLCASLGTF